VDLMYLYQEDQEEGASTQARFIGLAQQVTTSFPA